MSIQLDSPADQVDSSLSVQEAAAHFAVSEKTIRRRIKVGSLHAFQQPTSQGFEWRVQLDGQADQVDGARVQLPPQHAVQVDSTEEPPAPAAEDAALLKSLEMVDRLQRENLELAGQLGFVQAKLQAAEHRILLLEAGPAAEQTFEVAPNAGQDSVQAPGQTQPAVTKPFWRRLFSRK